MALPNDAAAPTPAQNMGGNSARPSNRAQRESASYLLPSLDESFILGDSQRGLRFLLEYAKAEELLRKWGVRSTIVVFGSARARPLGEGGPTHGAIWYEQARRFGFIASQRGGALKNDHGLRDHVIATGGGPGVMEAANRGAHEAGAPTIGFNISLPREQEPNPYTTPELTFSFHYFAMRKMHFAMRARALVVFPGGFGTLDELFEILTLRQTNKAPPLPVVLLGRAYWSQVVNFEFMIAEGVIERSDCDLFAFADDAEMAWRELVSRGLLSLT
jgi:uncharacterized protein (TIGR00730 family)